MNTFIIKTKTANGFPAKTICWKNKEQVGIERRYLVPTQLLKEFQTYKEIRKFKGKSLIYTEIIFNTRTMITFVRGIRMLLMKEQIMENLDYELELLDQLSNSNNQ